MVTCKVKLRQSTLEGKPGVLYYQLCHRQKTKQLTTRMRVFPHQWDAENEQLIIRIPEQEINLVEYSRRLQNDKNQLQRIIRDLEVRNEMYTLDEVFRIFRKPDGAMTVVDFFQGQIGELKRNGKLGTARNYQRTLYSFSHFLIGADLSFPLITQDLIEDYSQWLQKRQVVRNTQSFYMRILRSVYNKAVLRGGVLQTFPFTRVYTGIDRTGKRAVSEEEILRLQALPLASSSPLSLARDLFIFSYGTRGMAFVDIAFLRKKDLIKDRIQYVRRKTGQSMVVKIEPCIENIIRKYAQYNPHSPYVFPLIRSLNTQRAFTEYQTALGYYNRQLKRLAEKAGINQSISSYTPRHTWATTARNHHIPLSIISEGMGHSSEKTTRIYLASLDHSVIDQANHRILAALNR